MHCFDANFQCRSAALQAQELSERHTGEYIAVKIIKMLDNWKISLSQVHIAIRDNGSNMIKAMTRLTYLALDVLPIPCSLWSTMASLLGMV